MYLLPLLDPGGVCIGRRLQRPDEDVHRPVRVVGGRRSADAAVAGHDGKPCRLTDESSLVKQSQNCMAISVDSIHWI